MAFGDKRPTKPWTDPYANDPCRICGVPVGARPRQGRRRMFCSETCRAVWNQGRKMQPQDPATDLPADVIERIMDRAYARIQEERRRMLGGIAG